MWSKWWLAIIDTQTEKESEKRATKRKDTHENDKVKILRNRHYIWWNAQNCSIEARIEVNRFCSFGSTKKSSHKKLRHEWTQKWIEWPWDVHNHRTIYDCSDQNHQLNWLISRKTWHPLSALTINLITPTWLGASAVRLWTVARLNVRLIKMQLSKTELAIATHYHLKRSFKNATKQKNNRRFYDHFTSFGIISHGASAARWNACYVFSPWLHQFEIITIKKYI